MNQPTHPTLARMATTAMLSTALLAACGGSSGGGFSFADSAAAKPDNAQAEADVPPAIAFQPHSALVKEGEPAMFGVMGMMGVMGGAVVNLRADTDLPWR